MTNTDEAFRKYCEAYGPCNRVVFDAAFQMGREAGLSEAEEMVDSEIDHEGIRLGFEFLRKHN